MSKIIQISHPLLLYKLTLINDKNTSAKNLRKLVEEVAMLMAYEVTRDFNLKEVEVKTHICETKSKALASKKIVIVPISRAGFGMSDGILKLIPTTKVGHIGLYRDEKNLTPVEYFCKLPQDMKEREIIVTVPMLVTGGFVSHAIYLLKKRGAKYIKLICLVAAPEGMKVVMGDHPDVDIYVVSIDEKDHIVPSLGNAEDRFCGTM